MSIRIIDLSVPFDNDSKEPVPPKIEYQAHHETTEHAANAFGLQPSDWPEGGGWAVEMVHATTHTGTHVDAPYHYWYKTGDKPARTIDELPLEWFYGNGVILNFTWKKPGEEISTEDVTNELKRINHELSPGEIVMIRTDCDKYLYNPDYGNLHPGMSAEATRYLISCGIKVMGTDGYGWDVPFKVMADQYRETGDKSVIWAAHYVGKELEYCQIEKLANLGEIPNPTGFKVATFPIKIKGASAGWARPVAIIEE
jgi:kynurenine formamidase